MKKNKKRLLSFFAIAIILFSIILITSFSGLLGPGEHCESNTDCSDDAPRCLYAICSALPGADCSCDADCIGSEDLMGCESGECCGKDAYPCGNVNTGPDQDYCCEGYTCVERSIGAKYQCVKWKGTSDRDEPELVCDQEDCNIGHTNCNNNPPPKTQTVESNEICNFTGTITNSHTVWTNPATLTISGPNSECQASIQYNDCDTVYYSVTCESGTVTFSADDSSYFTMEKTCWNIPYCGDGVIDSGEECDDGNNIDGDGCSAECEIEEQEPFCGDGNLDFGETCELPNTFNNVFCLQNTQQCLGNKLGTRDLYGNCDGVCGCSYDSFEYSCVKGQCGAECGSDDDCPGSFCSITYYDYCSNKKLTEYDNDKIKDSTTVSDAYDNNCLDTCFCTDNSADCSPPETNTYCVAGECGAECAIDSDCDDQNENTLDICNNCICEYTELPYCGDGNLDSGEECDDGNNIDGDGCSAECEIEEQEPFCGNGILETGEECDDGNNIDGDGCSAECEIEEPACYFDIDCGIDHCAGGPNYCLFGDVYQDFWIHKCINPGEFNAYCSIEIGPKLIEECEYGCENGYCTDEPVPYCGDGVLNEGEECDDGENNGQVCTPEYNGSCDYCSNTCEIEQIEGSYCGDGILDESYEECDDSNNIDGDGCSAECEIEEQEPFCGNGIIEGNETCDEGENNGIECDNSKHDCDYCSSNCKIITLQSEDDDSDGDSSISVECEDWSECFNGIQTRICYETDGCSYYEEILEERACVPDFISLSSGTSRGINETIILETPFVSSEPVRDSMINTLGFWKMILIIILALLVAAGIIFIAIAVRS